MEVTQRTKGSASGLTQPAPSPHPAGGGSWRLFVTSQDPAQELGPTPTWKPQRPRTSSVSGTDSSRKPKRPGPGRCVGEQNPPRMAGPRAKCRRRGHPDVWKTLARPSHAGAEGGADANAGACWSPGELAGAGQQREAGGRGQAVPAPPHPQRCSRPQGGPGRGLIRPHSEGAISRTASIKSILMLRFTHPCARRGSRQAPGRTETTAAVRPERLLQGKPSHQARAGASAGVSERSQLSLLGAAHVSAAQRVN